MIESIEFKNFKALRDTTLPLSPCTIIVGPNGSGKSTVLQALEAVQTQTRTIRFPQVANFRIRDRDDDSSTASVKLRYRKGDYECQWTPSEFDGQGRFTVRADLDQLVGNKLQGKVHRIRVFSLDANRIATPSPVQGIIELASDGAGLATVLDGMRDDAPEQFKAIERQIGEWLPEFDRILFDRPQTGFKSVALRTRQGGHKVPATDLSQGTLIALALLTLAYHPTPPSLIALEEPDRGIHPHLLRHVKDTLYRLSHPESCGETRPPVQVIATTHNPFFLDLFKEFPEEVVIANKVGADVQFQRLSDQPHVKEYLEDAHLSDVWYTGILGGVPCNS
jgi:predicted ATPase